MINFTAFKDAHKKYTKKDMPFLAKMREKVQDEKCYKDLTIFHHIPLTIESILKMEILLLGGADVTASCINALMPFPHTLSILRQANVKIELVDNNKREYDFYLDCCGELVKLKPKYGFVELTQTGSEIYKKAKFLNVPVISVDDSKIKVIETLFGTGDGFVRALKTYTKDALKNKNILVFGYGKVGHGIVHALKKITKNIVVIDINEQNLKIATKKGLDCFNGNNKQEVKNFLKHNYCVVTATGIKNLITDYYGFKKSDFGNALLANMGGEDEYGNNFARTDILFDKKPLNFSLSEPTIMRYLDPMLYAHNLGINLILDNTYTAGYHPFSPELAEDILKEWQIFHNEDITVEDNL